MKLTDVFAVARDAELAGDPRLAETLAMAGPAAGFYRLLFAPQRALPMTRTEERLFAARDLLRHAEDGAKVAETWPVEILRPMMRDQAKRLYATALELIAEMIAELAAGNVGERAPVHGPRIPKPRKRRRKGQRL